ncbi:EscF/YscF/HrpA family type III secretion system needle major subunit [Halochromatium roseum]|uniref:EscF/YscF/HrpA family type III secretion system needle major subunit n=1 Tax=Halochromatium roseum TaxID=391920 RepID=UPI0019149889|nr:EscF/YscF/HrpA family type III secretion system needle major subunit [Halochromatium roseum]
MTISVGSLIGALGKEEQAIQDKLNDPDFKATDSKQMLEIQMRFSNYQQISGITSAIISDLKQAAQGVIQKV